jgi:hypothetical protein
VAATLKSPFDISANPSVRTETASANPGKSPLVSRGGSWLLGTQIAGLRQRQAPRFQAMSRTVSNELPRSAIRSVVSSSIGRHHV